MVRCTATFKADTDRPLANAAFFKDISLSLSRLMARRCSGARVAMAACRAAASANASSKWRFAASDKKVSCSSDNSISRDRARIWRRSRSMMRRLAMATSHGPNGRPDHRYAERREPSAARPERHPRHRWVPRIAAPPSLAALLLAVILGGWFPNKLRSTISCDVGLLSCSRR